MNTWKKLVDGSWGVCCGTQQQFGDVVAVTNRAGAVKQVTLGAFVKVDRPSGCGIWAVAQAPKAEAPAAQQVGDLTGVLALFERTKGKLKYPAIVLEVVDPQGESVSAIRLTVAGPQAKAPGSVTVTTLDKVWNRFEGCEKREWLGRVLTDGTYQPARAANGRTGAIAARLRDLAQDPVKVATQYGRATGCCCFCNLPLGGKSPDSVEGRKSLAVGYGRKCAANYGLPWGEEKFSFQAEAVNAEGR